MTAVGDSVPKPLRFIRFGDIRWNIEKRRHFCRRFPPFFLTACVRPLLSVALFGCNFSIVRNLAIIAFTRFIFRNRFSSRSTTSFFIIVGEFTEILFAEPFSNVYLISPFRNLHHLCHSIHPPVIYFTNNPIAFTSSLYELQKLIFQAEFISHLL